MCPRKLHLSGQTCPEETLGCVFQKIEDRFQHLFVKRPKSVDTRKDRGALYLWDGGNIQEIIMLETIQYLAGNALYHVVYCPRCTNSSPNSISSSDGKCTASASHDTLIAYVCYLPEVAGRSPGALATHYRRASPPPKRTLIAKMLVYKKPRRLARVAARHPNR